jgi:hypothetical protein
MQVGDFGDGWPGSERFQYTGDLPFHWLDGNHENYDLLDAGYTSSSKLVHYQPRGSVLELDKLRVMFFGGASSIDKKHRTMGKSWWPQEEITYGQVSQALQVDRPIHAVFSHEHPVSIPYNFPGMKDGFGLGDQQGLDALMSHFRPDFWFFGHYHDPDFGKVNNTTWVCCPIIDSADYVIWDGKSVYTSWAGYI